MSECDMLNGLPGLIMNDVVVDDQRCDYCGCHADELVERYAPCLGVVVRVCTECADTYEEDE